MLIIIASIAKIVPVSLTAKLCTRKSWRYCTAIGVLMNTRGIVQLVVLNIGVELKVISPIIFAMFVLMATILTFLTSPILYLLYREETNKDDLSMDHVAEELRDVRNSYVIMNVLENASETGSVGGPQTEEQRRSSSRNVPPELDDPLRCDTYLTQAGTSDNPRSSVNGDPPAVLQRTVSRTTQPRHSSSMIHF